MASGASGARWLGRPGRGRWPALVVLLTLLIGAALVWLAGADTTVGQPLVMLSRPIAIHGSQRVGQTFMLPADGLHRVDLVFATRRRIRDRTVRLIITDAAGQPLLSKEYDARLLRDGWHSFTFPPLGGVAGQPLELEVRRNVPAAQSVGLMASPGYTYEGQGVFEGQLDDSFDLAFRAYTTTPPTPADRLARVGDLAVALTAGRPGPLGQPAVLLGLGALYVVGLAGLGSLVLAQARRP